MQIYPIEASFRAGESFELGVQPNRRFSLAIYQQHEEALTHFSGVVVASANDVNAELTQGKYVFRSIGDASPKPFDRDWGWPTLTLRPHARAVKSGAYVAVAYEVDTGGKPLNSLGRRVAAGLPVYGAPPDSDSMALIIALPCTPTAPIAYIIPIASYHAYNSIGGGSFYNDPVHRSKPAHKVSLRRPGGGFGARLGEPADPYDNKSPRQQFTHWNAKFTCWLRAQSLPCDFYTDLDLHANDDLNAANYRCLLSVGHHEYWSQAMRDRAARFLADGGNLAVFSGNTCYRPIDFGPEGEGPPKEINLLAHNWPGFNESDLLGMSYGYGGGKTGVWRRLRGGWIQLKRDPTGYEVLQPDHWVFADTGLKAGEVFGAEDRLVGYEVDGVPTVPNGFNTLGRSPPLVGWDIGGVGAMGIFGDESVSAPKRGLVFNGGSTDWARVLMSPNATSQAIVAQITTNVICTFLGLPTDGRSRRDASAQDFNAAA